MPSAERRAREAKKDAEASAKRHAKGLPVAMEELTRLRALAECWYVLIKLHLHLCRSRADKDNVMCWKDEALGAPMHKKLKLPDNHRYTYTDLSGQAKCLIGTSSIQHEKYKYALKNHTKTMQDIGEYSVMTRFLMCPGGKWKDSCNAECWVE
jgi:hypothetical protein